MKKLFFYTLIFGMGLTFNSFADNYKYVTNFSLANDTNLSATLSQLQVGPGLLAVNGQICHGNCGPINFNPSNSLALTTMSNYYNPMHVFTKFTLNQNVPCNQCMTGVSGQCTFSKEYILTYDATPSEDGAVVDLSSATFDGNTSCTSAN